MTLYTMIINEFHCQDLKKHNKLTCRFKVIKLSSYELFNKIER